MASYAVLKKIDLYINKTSNLQLICTHLESKISSGENNGRISV